MSFNANTLYRGVDVEELAKECKDAITGDDECFVLVDMFGEVAGVYLDRHKAEKERSNRSLGDEDGYWFVVASRLIRI